MLNFIKDFNGIHSQLFEYNDYTKYSKFSKTFNKLDTCKMFVDSEKLFSRILFDLSGKICIKVEEDLSIDLLNTTIDSISIEDFKNLPFNFFQIDTKNIESVDRVYVSKNSAKVHFHFEGVGANKLSVQFVLSNDGIFPKYTYSSLFYHREIQPISSEIKIICENCLRYIISVIFYLINFQENQNKVVKNVEYENYLKKLSPKHLSKPKIQKKLKNKSDTVILKFDVKPTYIYNFEQNITNKKISTKFLVKGHWRNQRIGKRELSQTTKIWIKPHFKGLNNETYKNKIYKIS